MQKRMEFGLTGQVGRTIVFVDTLKEFLKDHDGLHGFSPVVIIETR